MKKILIVSVAIAVALMFVTACGSDDGGGGACGSVCNMAKSKCEDFVVSECMDGCNDVTADMAPAGVDAVQKVMESCLAEVDDCDGVMACFGPYM